MIADLQALEDWSKPNNSENHSSNDQTFQTLSVVFQTKMESMGTILENFLSAIDLVKFRRYPPDQDCVFIVPDIINDQLRIRMEVINEN